MPFQFHIGTIKSAFNATGTTRSVEFQFHIGTIKRTLIKILLQDNTNFNSTLVRLKVAENAFIQRLTLFQFHIGTIKSEYIAHLDKVKAIFQFHIGTIKSSD